MIGFVAKQRDAGFFHCIPGRAARAPCHLDLRVETGPNEFGHVTNSVRVLDSRLTVLLQQTMPFLADRTTHRQ